MITRDAVVAATVAELEDWDDECRPEHAELGGAIADRLGLHAVPARPRSCLFVRQLRFVPVAVAARFDVVIVCARVESAVSPGRIVAVNRDREWYASVRAAGTDVVLWDWMFPPGMWKPSLRELVAYAADVGAIGVCLNVEPASKPDKGTSRDWRGQRDELAAYTRETRDLCDAHRLELWVTSWSTTPTGFSLDELVRRAHVSIPQPYEVHGRTGPEYVADVLEHWRDAGAKRIILGRGAHELDRSDADSWRTPAQIREHRRSTPAGMDEAWWPPATSLGRRTAEVDAMVEVLDAVA